MKQQYVSPSMEIFVYFVQKYVPGSNIVSSTPLRPPHRAHDGKLAREMADARARLEREAEARAKDLAAKKGALMRRILVSQLYSPDKVQQM